MFSEWQAASANVFPEYADLHCAGDGTLWLQPFDAVTGRLGRGPDWYRISRNDVRTLVTLPAEFRPYRFEPDRIWGTIHDSLGIASVAWIVSGERLRAGRRVLTTTAPPTKRMQVSVVTNSGTPARRR